MVCKVMTQERSDGIVLTIVLPECAGSCEATSRNNSGSSAAGSQPSEKD